MAWAAATLAGAAHADVGGSLSLQTDARDRGMSYSDGRPTAQFGLSWDDSVGWYAGASLAQARFTERRAGWLRLYGGQVLPVSAALQGEWGVLAHRFQNVSRYDFVEAYAGLLAERWNLRVYASPDYYGVGRRSVYGEVNLRWPVLAPVAVFGHVGVLRGFGHAALPLYTEPHGPVRIDIRAGLSWPWGDVGEWQLAAVSASRGGPYTWTDGSPRHAITLGFTVAF
ncbi:TorF family putative porin [Roseateles cellulosilyticus]|uniref:Cellulose biosynthesis protein BcsS n=1 Tax=Pelomonas cellulosilytica TaxID=2906762 RepID=A0ABS8XV47_9BURK|nr:TorF family putative porin [Pelomonas sp. P8]MCE4554594.1 hypothetical protein [Pelomonas sp. P8]